ncbi:MAG: hypothetical protein LAP21_25850, partial [Acidobacteriia bacterium]|nr:hypothetical protein [Terriglobia bacterium]
SAGPGGGVCLVASPTGVEKDSFPPLQNRARDNRSIFFEKQNKAERDFEPSFTVCWLTITEWETENSRPIKRWQVVRIQNSKCHLRRKPLVETS